MGDKIEDFLQKANSCSFQPTALTAEISETENTLDTKVYKGGRFNRESILKVRTHFKPTETFLYTNYYSCHQRDVTKGFIKGEAFRLLRTNSFRFVTQSSSTWRYQAKRTHACEIRNESLDNQSRLREIFKEPPIRFTSQGKTPKSHPS